LLAGREILKRGLKLLDGFVSVDDRREACTRIDFKGAQAFGESGVFDLERLGVGDADGQFDQITQLGRLGVDLGLYGRGF
jgi:hypothetical protein